MGFFDFEASIPLKLNLTFSWGGGRGGGHKFVLARI